MRQPSENRYSTLYKKWRTLVLERDLHTCVKCGKKKEKVDCHHIVSWDDDEKLRFSVDNGQTLCSPCHQSYHMKNPKEKKSATPESYNTRAKKALRDWLKTEKVTIYRLAKLLNMTYPICHQWVKKANIPNLSTAIKIEELTNGMVPCMLWKEESPAEKKVVKKNANASNKTNTHETSKQSKTSPKGKR